MTQSNVPDSFKSKRQQVSLVGGPQDGDTIVVDVDVKALHTRDADDSNLRYFYLRGDEKTFVFTNSYRNEPKDKND